MIVRLYLFLVLFIPTLVWAQESSWLEKDRISLNLGGFAAKFDSTARISPGNSIGSRISFEDDLGFDDTEFVMRIDTSIRITERSSVQIEYIDLDRDGKNTTDRELIVDETTYPAGSRIDSSFDYRALKLAYTHSIWQTSRFDLGLTGGLLVFDLDLDIESETGLREGDDDTSPFPMVGLRGSWLLQPRLFLRAYLEYFKISNGGVDGELNDYLVALEHRFGEGWGAGLGYNYVELDVEDSDSNDEFYYEYDGLLLYLKLAL